MVVVRKKLGVDPFFCPSPMFLKLILKKKDKSPKYLVMICFPLSKSFNESTNLSVNYKINGLVA